LIFLASGCGKSDEEEKIEKQIEESTGAEADVDLSRKSMKVSGKTEGGEYTVTSGEGTGIPEGFPEDVFIYRPSKTGMAMEIPQGYSVALTTGDEASKVRSAYSREMEAKGWSEQTSMNMENQSVLVYEKDDRLANITIVSSGKEIQVSVTVTKE